MEAIRPSPYSSWLLVGDVLMAVAVLSLIQLELWVFEAGELSLAKTITASAVAPAVALPLALRTRDAASAFAVNALATFVLVTIGYASDFYQWPNLVLLFMVSVQYRGPKSWLALAAGLLGVVYYFTSLLPNEWDIGVVVLALWTVSWMTGRVYGSRIEEGRLRADRDLAAEVAATRQERLELEAQRTAMARELHDLIGHTVNVMVVHAGAGRRAVHADPSGAEQAFDTIETTGRSALEELDRVLGVLRRADPETPLAPLPGLADLAGLVADVDQPDLEARLTVAGPADLVPPGIALTVYRIVQESLTNTLKHADASEVSTEVTIGQRTIAVTVTDGRSGKAVQPSSSAEPAVTSLVPAATDESVGALPPPSHRRRPTIAEAAQTTGGSGGRGVAGIAERVRLHHGSIEFGPIAGHAGGYRVHCVLPLSPNERDR